MGSVLSRLTIILAAFSGRPADSILPATPIADLGLDSLDVAECAAATETEFGILLSGDEFIRYTTVGEFSDRIGELQRLLPAESAGNTL